MTVHVRIGKSTWHYQNNFPQRNSLNKNCVGVIMAVALILEFLATLLKVIWISLVAAVKTVLPLWRKKDASKEIVLITGAGSGIGRLMSLEFAKLGATLVLWDINEEGNDAVKKEVEAMGRVAHAFKVDCSKREEIYAAADKVKVISLSGHGQIRYDVMLFLFSPSLLSHSSHSPIPSLLSSHPFSPPFSPSHLFSPLPLSSLLPSFILLYPSLSPLLSPPPPFLFLLSHNSGAKSSR